MLMNKKLLAIGAVITLAIIGGFVFLLMRDKPANAPSTTDVVQETPPAPATPEPAPLPAEQTTPGAYVTYSPEALANAKGTKVLFFHAAWCPQCRQLEAQIKAGPLPDNVTIFKVDYDSNQVLRQKYGVQLQTTFVKVDASGNLIQKYVAYSDPTLQAIKEHIL